MGSEHVINTSAATFSRDVLEQSQRQPVLVDFWAQWCAPCRSIAPLLEELAGEFAGRLTVAKVDTDVEQELAQSYAVRSLPTLMTFRHGTMVEQIIGAQPAHVLRAAVEKLLPRPGDDLIAEATRLIEIDDMDAAAEKLRAALALDPRNYAVHRLLVRVLARQGAHAEAEQLIDALPVNISADAAFDDVKAALKLARQLPLAEGREAVERRARVGTPDALFQLAVWQAVDGDFDLAMEGLFSLLASHRTWNDGAVHKTILDVFKVMSGDDPRLKTYRTQLARTLN
jgi:putative thioredoxin